MIACVSGLGFYLHVSSSRVSFFAEQLSLRLRICGQICKSVVEAARLISFSWPFSQINGEIKQLAVCGHCCLLAHAGDGEEVALSWRLGAQGTVVWGRGVLGRTEF